MLKSATVSWFLGLTIILAGLCPADAGDEPPPCLRIAVPDRPHIDTANVRRIVKELYAEAGLCLRLSDIPLPRSENNLLTGEYDGEAMRYSGYIVARPHLVAVKTPLLGADIYWLALKTARTPAGADLAALLAGRPVAVPAQISYFENLVRQTRIVPVSIDRPDQLPPLLAGKRVAFGFLMEGGLRALPPEELSRLDARKFQHIQYHHVLRREHAWALPRLDAAARRLKAAGRLVQAPLVPVPESEP